MSGSYTNTNARAEGLNQAAAHDTGLYDPNVHDNQIVAMFENESAARSARDALVANGIPESAIHLANKDESVANVGAQDNGSLWGAIKSLFMPDDEAHGYAEGIRRGHAVLVVQPTAEMDRHRIITLLESNHPIDFDAKLEEWRQAGYNYSGSSPTGVATDTSGMRSVDTTAAGTFRNAPSTAPRENDYMSGEQTDDMPGGAYESPQEARSASTRTAGTMATPPAQATTIADENRGVRADASRAGQDETIKLAEERLRIGKREVVKGAVRVRSYIVERPVEEQVRLHDERVEVERHPVDRRVEPGDNALFQERVIEARATGEEPVVSKEARVTEEIGLRKEATERTETVRDTVRKTEVEIDGDPNVSGSTTAARPATSATERR